ncbi:MAG TPA: dipeptidase [Longimicrobium sp.]|jgi:acetylornithine deacetylase/succinyl-diaminopimelate desuccinylase-like protein|uniref:dipeptidase n=1 Tax=Longimicrobium sp. TaxID=2029185 RepID=UPI002ED969F2
MIAPAAHPALAYARARRAVIVDELKRFVAIPSVAGDPAHAADVRRCAEWLAEHLRCIGLDARVERTSGAPLVVGRWSGAPGRPTVLVYGHYDVQPADHPAEWTSPPFQPAVRGDELFGRGACDDKGQLWAHVKAIEALLRTTGRLPVNVLCVFEGEEEAGSAGLLDALRRSPERFAADVALVSDTPMRAPGRPGITYALRGALSLEVEVRGPRRDLHSGVYGGAIHNPLQALCEIVARLHGADGRIAIPGLYDGVHPPAPGERAYLARSGPADAELLANAGDAPAGWGEHEWSAYERCTLRPSLSVNGISGGHAGEGGMAVIPARAVAKLSLRLVPGQDPARVERLVRRHIPRLAPRTVMVEVRTRFGAHPARMDPRHPALRTAALALRDAFGVAPVFLRSGGTIPVVNALMDALGAPVVLMGLARPGDGMHAPDERMHLPTLFRGIDASIRFLCRMGETAPALRGAIR